jgi:lipid-binding SYLF domain-containing protein
VALVTVGGGSIDTNRITSPIVGFIFDGKGLMCNLTLEGSKISRISR